jgi:TolA-binding protein
MSKKLFVLIVAIATICSMAAAQGQKGPTLAAWLKGLQQKIAQIAPKKSVTQSPGIADVRGSKGNASVKLYWKGKKGEAQVTEEELTELKKGIDLAVKGDMAGAIKELDEFMKQYPDSALIPDAKKTLELVKTAEK